MRAKYTQIFTAIYFRKREKKRGSILNSLFYLDCRPITPSHEVDICLSIFIFCMYINPTLTNKTLTPAICIVTTSNAYHRCLFVFITGIKIGCFACLFYTVYVYRLKTSLRVTQA